MNDLDKQRFIGGINFEELRAQRVQVYNTITVDLTTARSNEEYVFTGTYIYALNATDITANVNVKFNELFRGEINLVKGRGVRCPFYRFYLSNAAQAGKTITLAIGIESADFEIFDVGKALEITGAVPIGGAAGTPAYAQVSVTTTATLIKAANGKRRSLLVQNLDATNDLCIGYDASVTTANAGHSLKPGAAIELYYTGTIYGIRSAGSGNAGYLEECN
jgi:hypothetical protein